MCKGFDGEFPKEAFEKNGVIRGHPAICREGECLATRALVMSRRPLLEKLTSLGDEVADFII